MVIGCMRLTDVTCYEVRYDSDRVTDVAKNLFGGGCLYEAYSPEETVKWKLDIP